MKKGLFFSVLFLLASCNNDRIAEEVKLVAVHPSYVQTETNIKATVYWTVELKDEFNNLVHNILLNDYGYFLAQPLNEDKLKQLARELASQIDTPLRNPRITKEGEVIPGKARVILSEQELVEKLQMLEVGTKELVLPIYVTEPSVSEEDLVGIEAKIIGEFKTYFNPAVSGRATNVKLSADEISGIVLGPGDTFSFNQIVGERTRERGYQEAKEIVNKEFVTGIGGGICQTSSTLFNAVDQAGLEMIERYTHSREVGYVPIGRDATVSWKGPDFRFSNPHPYPVLLQSEIDVVRGEITVSVHTHQ
jgi:vancomycin resistance protein YoaR